VLMVVLVGMYAKVRIYQPLRQLRRPWVVESVEPAAQDAWELTLTAQGHDGIRFQPGQFAWVTLGTSPFAIREHPFSFSSSAEHPDRVSFTVKELGDFTTALDRFEPGTRAYLDGPYGVFSYERNEAAGFVFIAGGIGISPIMSMLRTLADRDDRRPMVLLFGAPTRADVALDEELDELSERLDLRVTYVLEDPPEGWEGETGVLSPEVLDRHLPRWRGGTQYFVCGPDVMMDAVESSLLERGVPEDHINLERFDLT
jgi:predicted ferric reductase